MEIIKHLLEPITSWLLTVWHWIIVQNPEDYNSRTTNILSQNEVQQAYVLIMLQTVFFCGLLVTLHLLWKTLWTLTIDLSKREIRTNSLHNTQFFFFLNLLSVQSVLTEWLKTEVNRNSKVTSNAFTLLEDLSDKELWLWSHIRWVPVSF